MNLRGEAKCPPSNPLKKTLTMCLIESSPDYSQKIHHRELVIDEVMCSIIIAEHKSDLCLCKANLTCSNEISYSTDQVP